MKLCQSVCQYLNSLVGQLAVFLKNGSLDFSEIIQ